MLLRKMMYHSYRFAPRMAWALHGLARRWGKSRTSDASGQSDWRSLEEQAQTLQARSRELRDVAAVFDLARQNAGIASDQHRGEILPFLALLREKRPRLLCEIGSARGGTLFLFAQVAHPRARILSIDMNNTVERRAIFARLVQPEQELTCIQGSSHAREREIDHASRVGADRLDCVFIDGDHSADGVARDYEQYGVFVRAGGLIAFHDIVPDYHTRYGINTGAYAGGVPAFWSKLTKETSRVHEFVEHPLQDGYGIGVIEVTQ